MKFLSDGPIWDLLCIPPTPAVSHSEPEYHCSFCGKAVNRLQATFGQGKPRKFDGGLIKTRDKNGVVIDFETKVIHAANHIIACPEHVNLIKPIFKRCQTCKGKSAAEIANCPDCKGTKEGERIHNGIEFPQSEG